MALHPNRPGGLRGDDGTTLKQLKAEMVSINATLSDVLTELQAQTGAAGNPAATTCNLTQIELLCSINTLLGGSGDAPVEPAFRCSELYQAGYWVSGGWLSTIGSRINAANVFYPDFDAEYNNPDATIVSLTLAGDSAAFPTLIPGIVARTVCMSAYAGEGVAFFGIDRYIAATQAYHDSAILGVTDFSDVWTAGVAYNVDPDYVYRFYLVMPEGVTVPAAGTYLFYTEGALG